MATRSTASTEASGPDPQIAVTDAFVAFTDLLKSANADVLDNCRKMMEQYVGDRQSARPSATEAWHRLLNTREKTFAEANYLLLRQGLGRAGAGSLRVELDSSGRLPSLVGEALAAALGIVVGIADPNADSRRPDAMVYAVIPIDHLSDHYHVFSDGLGDGPVTLMTFDEHHITGCWQGSIDIDELDAIRAMSSNPDYLSAS